MTQIVRLKPKLLVVSFALGGYTTRFTTQEWSDGLSVTLRQLAEGGTTLVELGHTPLLQLDPASCLTLPSVNPKVCAGHGYAPGSPSNSRFGAAEVVAVKSTPRATYVDVTPWLCTSDLTCPAIVDNRVAYIDTNHISAQYTVDLAPLLAMTLDHSLS